MFNRLISRKKYLCRSRAIQIAMNVGVVEEWVARIGLPKAVGGHFACVRQLLSWLQVSLSCKFWYGELICCPVLVFDPGLPHIDRYYPNDEVY